MPPSPAARASVARARCARRRPGAPPAGQDVEGERQQRVAGEDGGRLVERLVDGRHAAPEIVVVHGRQVVVDERIAVHAFDRGRGEHRVRRLDAEEPRRLDDQERAEALAAGQHGVAHGGDEARRAEDLAGLDLIVEDRREGGFDLRGRRGEAFGEGVVTGGRHRRGRLRARRVMRRRRKSGGQRWRKTALCQVTAREVRRVPGGGADRSSGALCAGSSSPRSSLAAVPLVLAAALRASSIRRSRP